MFTVEQFKEYIKKNRIEFIQIKQCEICNHKIGYYFVDNSVFYNITCGCDENSPLILVSITWERATEVQNNINNEAFNRLSEEGNT